MFPKNTMSRNSIPIISINLPLVPKALFGNGM